MNLTQNGLLANPKAYGSLFHLSPTFSAVPAAVSGAMIVNTSACEPLVMLRHFSDTPDSPMYQ